MSVCVINFLLFCYNDLPIRQVDWQIDVIILLYLITNMNHKQSSDSHKYNRKQHILQIEEQSVIP